MAASPRQPAGGGAPFAWRLWQPIGARQPVLLLSSALTSALSSWALCWVGPDCSWSLGTVLLGGSPVTAGGDEQGISLCHSICIT